MIVPLSFLAYCCIIHFITKHISLCIVVELSTYYFRFASFLGKVLSELAVFGKTDYDISPFMFSREAIFNPNYQPKFWRGDISKAKL